MTTAADSAEPEPAAAETVYVGPEAVVPVERRRHERLRVYLRVRWEGLFGCYEGTVSDVSAGGCFILSEGQATLKELIRLEIELHTGEWVKVWGEVSNQFPGVGFGVRYTEVDGEDEDKFTLSLEQTKSIRAGVEALKRLNRLFSGPDGADVPLPRAGRQEYKARLVLAMQRVNETLLGLPECRKKMALRLCVQTYADLYRVWVAVAEGASGKPKELAEAYKRLKEKYEAPPDILQAARRGDTPTVLTFLRKKADIYLTFVS